MVLVQSEYSQELRGVLARIQERVRSKKRQSPSSELVLDKTTFEVSDVVVRRSAYDVANKLTSLSLKMEEVVDEESSDFLRNRTRQPTLHLRVEDQRVAAIVGLAGRTCLITETFERVNLEKEELIQEMASLLTEVTILRDENFRLRESLLGMVRESRSISTHALQGEGLVPYQGIGESPGRR